MSQRFRCRCGKSFTWSKVKEPGCDQYCRAHQHYYPKGSECQWCHTARHARSSNRDARTGQQRLFGWEDMP